MELTTPSHESRGGVDSALGASSETGENISKFMRGGSNRTTDIPALADGGVRSASGVFTTPCLPCIKAAPRPGALAKCQPMEVNNPVSGVTGIL